MKHLVGGLILICLTLLTGCSGSTTWPVWEIKCTDEYNNVTTRRFEGELYIDAGYIRLYPHTGGKEVSNQTCTYRRMGYAGAINNE